MLLKSVEKVWRPVSYLVGYSVEASLNEDIANHIVLNLRQQLTNYRIHINNQKDTGMYLIQQYTDGDWTPDTPFTHIVAVEVTTNDHIPDEMITCTIAEGAFLQFTHQGAESMIDATYEAIQIWLEEHDYIEPRSFDIEYWSDLDHLDQEDHCIHIYIPLTEEN